MVYEFIFLINLAIFLENIKKHNIAYDFYVAAYYYAQLRNDTNYNYLQLLNQFKINYYKLLSEGEKVFFNGVYSDDLNNMVSKTDSYRFIKLNKQENKLYKLENFIVKLLNETYDILSYFLII